MWSKSFQFRQWDRLSSPLAKLCSMQRVVMFFLYIYNSRDTYSTYPLIREVLYSIASKTWSGRSATPLVEKRTKELHGAAEADVEHDNGRQMSVPLHLQMVKLQHRVYNIVFLLYRYGNCLAWLACNATFKTPNKFLCNQEKCQYLCLWCDAFMCTVYIQMQ